MQIFRELMVEGDPDDLSAFVDRVDLLLKQGWSRDRKAEDELKPMAFHDRLQRCYRCEQSDRHPAGALWMVEGTNDDIRLSNIIPIGKNELTHDEYNRIAEEFYASFARPAADELGLKQELGSDIQTIEEFVSLDALQALRLLTRNAIRSTGSLYPIDRERRQEFIWLTHREDSPLTGDVLTRWLVEEMRWPEGAALEFGEEYDFGRSLLAKECLPA